MFGSQKCRRAFRLTESSGKIILSKNHHQADKKPFGCLCEIAAKSTAIKLAKRIRRMHSKRQPTQDDWWLPPSDCHRHNVTQVAPLRPIAMFMFAAQFSLKQMKTLLASTSVSYFISFICYNILSGWCAHRANVRWGKWIRAASLYRDKCARAHKSAAQWICIHLAWRPRRHKAVYLLS